jgi:hypothetical protein
MSRETERTRPHPAWVRVIGTVSIALGWVYLIGTPLLAVVNRYGWLCGRCFNSLPIWRDELDAFWVLLDAALGGVLVGAGVSLRRLRPRARAEHLFFAGLSLASVLAQMVDRLGWQGQNVAPGQIVALLGVCGLRMSYPIFTGIWFLRPCTRQEMLAWAREPTQAGLDGHGSSG